MKEMQSNKDVVYYKNFIVLFFDDMVTFIYKLKNLVFRLNILNTKIDDKMVIKILVALKSSFKKSILYVFGSRHLRRKL